MIVDVNPLKSFSFFKMNSEIKPMPTLFNVDRCHCLCFVDRHVSIFFVTYHTQYHRQCGEEHRHNCSHILVV